jgi:hypothetical protein
MPVTLLPIVTIATFGRYFNPFVVFRIRILAHNFSAHAFVREDLH